MPSEDVYFAYCVRKRYGTKAQDRYKKTHGKPVALLSVYQIARNLCNALNAGTIKEFFQHKDDPEEDAEFEKEMGLVGGLLFDASGKCTCHGNTSHGCRVHGHPSTISKMLPE